MRRTLKDFPLKLAPFVAPAVLSIVACLQLWTAATTDLSPWKGGGFGMFSTAESPSSRIIRVYFVTGATKLPVQVPERYRRLAAQIRTMPNQPDVERLALTLSAQSWAAYTIVPTQAQYYRRRQEYFAAPPPSIDTAASRKLRYAAELNELFGQMQWVRMVKGGEKSADLLEFKAIEVECLQMTFDRARGRLVLQSLAKAQAQRHADHER